MDAPGITMVMSWFDVEIQCQIREAIAEGDDLELPRDGRFVPSIYLDFGERLRDAWSYCWQSPSFWVEDGILYCDAYQEWNCGDTDWWGYPKDVSDPDFPEWWQEFQNQLINQAAETQKGYAEYAAATGNDPLEMYPSEYRLVINRVERQRLIRAYNEKYGYPEVPV